MTIGFGCITSSRFTMTATVLRAGVVVEEVPEGGGDPVQVVKKYERDPVSGEIIREWEEIVVDHDANPETAPIENPDAYTIKCQATPMITNGLNAQGSTERFTSKGDYEVADFVRLTFPKEIVLTRRDKITNIRDEKGKILWVEDERTGAPGTIFNCNGTAPVMDVYNNHLENYTMLERAEVQ